MSDSSLLLFEESPTVSGNNKDWLSHIKIGQRFDLELLSQRKIRCLCELLGYRAGKYASLWGQVLLFAPNPKLRY
ncbi:hypothetical protein A9165_03670 [Alishewanella sp. HH-ZS]|nr:hypothetical protein A9165_03670 [Alishewanella sp. HH-ZS]